MFTNKSNKYEIIILSYFLKDKIFIDKAIQNGIKQNWFQDLLLKQFFNTLLSYYYKFENVLTKNVYLELIQKIKDIDPSSYPAYDDFFEKIELAYEDKESFEFYFTSFRDEFIKVQSFKYIQDFVDTHSTVESKKNFSLPDFITKLNSLILEKQGKKCEFIDYFEDIDTQLKDLRNRKNNPEAYSGLKTYIPSLDKFFNGFEKGTLNIIAGMTGTGKSTIMKEFARRQCNFGKKKVLIISCEDDILIWCHKVTSAETQIALSNLLRGDVTDEQLKQIEDLKNNRLKDGNGYRIIELSAKQFTVQEIEMLIDQNTQNWTPDIIYIDQISLIAPTIRMKDRVDIEYGDIAKALRSLAKKLNLPIVAASQVNRKAVKDKKGDRFVEINTENLSQSDQIGQDSDSVFAIQMDKENPEKCNLKIIKQRNGPKDISIDLIFKGEYCCFLDSETEFIKDNTNSSGLEIFSNETKSITKQVNEITDSGSITDFLNSEDFKKINSLNTNSFDENILNKLPDVESF